MLKVIYKCPLCEEGTLELKNEGDGVKCFKCAECRCEIHFGSWEQQREFTGE